MNDGESVDFEVLGAGIATGFSWGWRLPSDLGLNPVVGNNPEVVFSVDYLNPTTIDRAKWYAHPNLAVVLKIGLRVRVRNIQLLVILPFLTEGRLLRLLLLLLMFRGQTPVR